MTEHSFTDKMGEISGFGGTYEEGCRTMLLAGLEWWDKHKCGQEVKFSSFQGVYGLINEETEAAKELTDYMNNAINKEATGAMMQACVNHLFFIVKNGWDKYVEEMEKTDDK